MKTHLAARAALLALALGTVSVALAAEPSFTGKWKFDPQKSQLAGLTYQIEDAGNGQYTFVFGDDKETLAFDGKDHMTKYGSTWSITPAGSKSWKWVQKRDGKVYSEATWTVADDGQTSTYTETETRPDGSTSKNETKLKRTAGSPTGGLVGTWEGSGTTVGSPTVMEITPWEGTGYAMKNPTYKSETEFKTDGKEYTPKGPRVAPGTSLTAKATGDKLELTYKLKGKTTETDTWEVSSDGKTLTQTANYPGESKPEVDVFDRE